MDQTHHGASPTDKQGFEEIPPGKRSLGRASMRFKDNVKRNIIDLNFR